MDGTGRDERVTEEKKGKGKKTEQSRFLPTGLIDQCGIGAAILTGTDEP